METIFCLGECVVDTRSNSLQRNGRTKRIEPKLMEVLCVLANSPGQVVLREELKERVWSDVVVGDDAVNRAMFALRNALGDDAKAPRYIETIPKKGYRLCCEVSPFKPEPEPEAGSRAPLGSDDAPLPAQQQGEKATVLARLSVRTLWLGAALCFSFVVVIMYGSWRWLGVSSELVIGKIIPVTHIAGSEKSMALNPETDEYAYIHDVGERTDLYIQPANGATALRITDDFEAVSSPKWLDAKRLVYVSCATRRCSIYRYQQGMETQKIYGNEKSIYGLDVDLADSSTVFFSEWKGKGRMELKRLNIETGEVTALQEVYSQLPANTYARVYRSEDQALFYSTPVDTAVAIRQLNLEDGSIIDWAAEFDAIDDIKMCRDQTLLVAGEYAGVGGIWRIMSSQNLPHLILRGSGTESIVDLEIDKRTMDVYYSTHQGNLDLKLFSQGMSEPDPLPALNSDMNDDDAVFSADGRYVYFVSDRSGSKEIWQYNLVNQSIRQITHLNAMAMVRPAISYNNQLLAVGYESEYRGMAVVAIDSGKVLASQPTESFQYPLSWSKDGKHFYASEYSQGFDVHQYDAKTLAAKAVYENAWLSVSEISDSSGLMFPIYGESQLQLYNFEHGAARKIGVTIPNFYEMELGHFLLSENAAFGLGLEGADRRVIKYPYDGSAPTVTLELPRWTWVSGIRKDGLAVIAEKHEMPRGAIMKFKLH